MMEQKQEVDVELVDEEQARNNSHESSNEDEVIEEPSEQELKIKQLEAELNETQNRLFRAQADYENFRRRSREEKEAAAKYRAQSLVEELLPVLDNFERALSVKAENEQSSTIMQGLEMVYRQLQDALIKEGVEEIPSVGTAFDPYLHQAVMQTESEEHEENEIVEELQKGYKLKDRVIRPAMVKVNSK
jgi:molecular chaperone GrpE